MKMALDDAKLAPQSIDYINAHATSTPQGDIEEARAIMKIFGEHAKSPDLWVSSTKSVTGHTLGASGALEAAYCALALQQGRVPPTANLDEKDPDVPFDCVPKVARERSIRHALSNSFGFGGTNAALVFSRFEG
jgi:3-oxoacyl-[acyl-carrier-protein] synthase II